MKKNLLSIVSALFLGLTANAQSAVYSNDFTADPNSYISSGSSGAFTHASDGSNWTITAAGTGEWDIFEYELPSILDLSGPNPTIKLSGVTTSDSALLSVMLVDQQGRSADKYIESTNPGFFFEIKKNAAAEDFTYNYNGQFFDIHGSLADGSGQGIVDSSKIDKIRFRVNPGWASQAHMSTITSHTYNKALNGTIKIGKLEIFGSTKTGIETIAVFENITLFPNPSNGSAKLTYENKSSQAAVISVYNAIGQEVYSVQTTSGNINLDLSSQSKGVYFVSIKTDAGISTQRLILN